MRGMTIGSIVCYTSLIMKIKFNLNINSVVEVLILSDFLVNFSLGLLAPIFAIYITGQIAGDGLRVIGTATAIYWLVRCVVSPFLGHHMDHTGGERDEFALMFTGSLIASIVPLFYTVAHQAWHLYMLQGILAFAYSMAVPGWRIMFTNHLDRGRVGLEWSLEDMGVGLATAAAAYAGSLIAERFGFTVLFICVSAVGFASTLLLLPIRTHIKSHREVMRIKKRRVIKENNPIVMPTK